MEFFRAGARYRERAFRAAHRVGKTEGAGGYELSLHLSGLYPDWWKGRRFDKRIKAWACGDTNQTTKEIVQTKLLGPIDEVGTGLIPGDLIIDYKRKASSIPDTIETIFVKHVSGGTSVLNMRSYEQGKKAFYGTEQDVILLDEEPTLDIYTQCLIRTMTTDGLVMLTFTPLAGMSEVVMQFMPGGADVEPGESGKYLVAATWEDAPHLTRKQKDELWASIPPHLRDAMTKGIPALGSGAIYPISEDDIVVDDFEVPIYWPRAYGFDVGWNATAAVWGARDRENDILYLTSCYKKGHSEPPVHVSAIQARGIWIPGVADPAARASSQEDGKALFDKYRKLGLKLTLANNAVEAGLFEVWTQMTTGKFKVFRSMTPWFEEFRLYRRDDKGKVVKFFDHLMDATRYLAMSGRAVESVITPQLYMEKKGIDTREYDPLTFGL